MTADSTKGIPEPDIKAAWDNIRQENFDEAFRQVEDISRDSCDYTESRLILARVAWLQGFNEAAMVILEEAAKDHPDDSRILTELAVLQLNEGQTHKALGTLDKVADFLPEAEITRYAALYSLGEKEQARETLKSLQDKIL